MKTPIKVKFHGTTKHKALAETTAINYKMGDPSMLLILHPNGDKKNEEGQKCVWIPQMRCSLLNSTTAEKSTSPPDRPKVKSKQQATNPERAARDKAIEQAQERAAKRMQENQAKVSGKVETVTEAKKVTEEKTNRTTELAKLVKDSGIVVVNKGYCFYKERLLCPEEQLVNFLQNSSYYYETLEAEIVELAKVSETQGENHIKNSEDLQGFHVSNENSAENSQSQDSQKNAVNSEENTAEKTGTETQESSESSENPESSENDEKREKYMQKLISVKGIAEKTAAEIMITYPTEEDLRQALFTNEHSFSSSIENGLRDIF